MKTSMKTILIRSTLVVGIYALIMILTKGHLLSRHYASLLIPIGINVILAVSLNLTVGFLGLLPLGHAGFMSVGAYAGCLLTNYLNLPMYVEFPLAILFGAIVAGLFGIIIGIPVLRLRGDYLAIVTLAFGEIIRSVINQLSITGGASGLKGIAGYSSYTSVYVMAVITILLITNLIHSRHGRAICAIRDNAIAAESVGINTTNVKLMAFVISSAFAGVAGVLYGHNIGFLTPATFDFNKSIEILVIVVMGGMGSIPGSIIAATLITALPELLRGADKYRMLIYAVALIAMMILNNDPRFMAFKEKLSLKKARGGK